MSLVGRCRTGVRAGLRVVSVGPCRVEDGERDGARAGARCLLVDRDRSRGILGRGRRRGAALLVRPGVGAVRLHERHLPAVDALGLERCAVVERDHARLDLLQSERDRRLFGAEDLPAQAEVVLAVVAGATGDVLVDIMLTCPPGGLTSTLMWSPLVSARL